MALKKRIYAKAGDTDPLTGQAEMVAGASVSAGDISAAVLYAREASADSNHVDGASVTVDSVTSTDNGDGTWDVVVDYTFDPTGAKSGGGDAFDSGGVYRCYLKFTYTDGDLTRHPGDGHIIVNVPDNYE